MEKNKEIRISFQTAIFIAIIIILLVTIVIMAFELNRKNLSEKTNTSNIEDSTEKQVSTKNNNLTETISNNVENENTNTNNIEDSNENQSEIKYKTLTENVWNSIKAEKDSKGNQRYEFMTNNIIKNSDGTYTIQGAIYELFERSYEHQGSIYMLAEEQGYYEITVSKNVICEEKVSTSQCTIEEYYRLYYADKQDGTHYCQTLFNNGGQDFVFENGACVQFIYHGK